MHMSNAGQQQVRCRYSRLRLCLRREHTAARALAASSLACKGGASLLNNLTINACTACWLQSCSGEHARKLKSMHVQCYVCATRDFCQLEQTGKCCRTVAASECQSAPCASCRRWHPARQISTCLLNSCRVWTGLVAFGANVRIMTRNMLGCSRFRVAVDSADHAKHLAESTPLPEILPLPRQPA